ncbi:MAG TPA: hypothetical protein ENJ82_17095 [Bacteroidetes bacterium]|nr:hypothetical protein [Bacteroidota bacterium]
MKLLNRIFTLLVFSILFGQVVNAQSTILQLPASQTLRVEQAITLNQSHLPQVDIYSIPGSGKIHVHVDNYRPSLPVNVTVFNSSNRLMRQEIGVICTICGTYDLDIEEELAAGMYRVIVTSDASIVVRNLYIR